MLQLYPGRDKGRCASLGQEAGETTRCVGSLAAQLFSVVMVRGNPGPALSSARCDYWGFHCIVVARSLSQYGVKK